MSIRDKQGWPRSITGADKGQAMIETIFMIPFLVVMIFFMYQAYTLVNKVEMVQKYLKTTTVARLLNRHTITAEDVNRNPDEGKTPPNDGAYFFVYDEYGGQKMMNYGLDDITVGLLMAFDTKSDHVGLANILKKGIAGKQALGLCIGGDSIVDGQVSPAVFNIGQGDTCNRK